MGPADLVEVDRGWVEGGGADFVFQELAGRRLEDRVLDVVHVSRMAMHTDGIDRDRLSYQASRGSEAPDEFRIAEQLFDGKFC